MMLLELVLLELELVLQVPVLVLQVLVLVLQELALELQELALVPALELVLVLGRPLHLYLDKLMHMSQYLLL
jgi:hypothetical protein